MLIGILGFGIVSGLLAATMAWQVTASLLLTFLAYSIFGSLGAVLYASAAALRSSEEPGELAED